MIPGLNPKQMRQAMKQMGLKQDDLPASEVIIKLPDRDIVVKNPSVQRIVMQGQVSFQVSGDVVEESSVVPDISDDDVDMVVAQTGCSREEARAAIEICEGDLAQAILELNDSKT